MSRRMPMTPVTLPPGSRSAAALSVVGMTSPEALRGFRRALRVEHRVARDAALHHLAQRGRELARLLRADEARERLLDELVLPEAEELGDGVVGLEDLALQVGDEDRVRGVLDQALGVAPRLVDLAHVAQEADRPAHLAVR